jgi:hypothetical protein
VRVLRIAWVPLTARCGLTPMRTIDANSVG